MVQADSRAAAHAEVLRKVFDLTGGEISQPLAESIIALALPSGSSQRIAALAEKANEGTLSEAEEAELEAYVNVGDLLALWQSKARQVLQRQA